MALKGAKVVVYGVMREVDAYGGTEARMIVT